MGFGFAKSNENTTCTLTRKSVAELYARMANIFQSLTEEAREILLRALNLRDKIHFASHEEHSKLKYDDTQCQSLFLHAIKMGLISHKLRSRMRHLLKTTHIKEEDLIAEMNVAATEEVERNSKLGLGTKAKAKLAQVERKTPKMDDPPMKRDSTEQLIKERQALNADAATLRQDIIQQRDRAPHQGERSVEGDQGRNSPGALICISKREKIVLIVGNVEPENIK